MSTSPRAPLDEAQRIAKRKEIEEKLKAAKITKPASPSSAAPAPALTQRLAAGKELRAKQEALNQKDSGVAAEDLARRRAEVEAKVAKALAEHAAKSEPAAASSTQVNLEPLAPSPVSSSPVDSQPRAKANPRALAAFDRSDVAELRGRLQLSKSIDDQLTLAQLITAKRYPVTGEQRKQETDTKIAQRKEEIAAIKQADEQQPPKRTVFEVNIHSKHSQAAAVRALHHSAPAKSHGVSLSPLGEVSIHFKHSPKVIAQIVGAVEADRKAKEQADSDRKANEQADADRKAKEQAEKPKREKKAEAGTVACDETPAFSSPVAADQFPTLDAVAAPKALVAVTHAAKPPKKSSVSALEFVEQAPLAKRAPAEPQPPRQRVAVVFASTTAAAADTQVPSTVVAQKSNEDEEAERAKTFERIREEKRQNFNKWASSRQSEAPAAASATTAPASATSPAKEHQRVRSSAAATSDAAIAAREKSIEVDTAEIERKSAILAAEKKKAREAIRQARLAEQRTVRPKSPKPTEIPTKTEKVSAPRSKSKPTPQISTAAGATSPAKAVAMFGGTLAVLAISLLLGRMW